ncbi:MAG: hypothetical protein JKY48_04890 [Flavobacteriales bacterium]|nr:hypothetical protein [Flavobacteriales bacterium]
MRKYFLLFGFIMPLSLLAQWTTASGITRGRNDDVFFVNDSIGYVAGGVRNTISKTVDGGDSWTNIFTVGTYLRSINFLDASTGFCGSLDTAFYMTVDSGNTWVDISSNISPVPKGICGLSSPNDSTIYGCGIYNEPAFIVKSTDRGTTWTYIDMSLYAKALVEVHFISQDTGFVAGRANPFADGGVILYTTDGGISWTSVYKTMRNLDYVWKIQSPDGQNYFASVSSVPNSGNTTFLKSTDSGLSWVQGIVDTAWYDIQMIGFIDSLKGWTGGANQLFETFDGGTSWNKTLATIPGGTYFNRFVKKNDSSAVISGLKIYKYDVNQITTGIIEPKREEDQIHALKVTPNPTSQLYFEVLIGNATHASIQLIDLQGSVLETFHHRKIAEGKHSFQSDKKYEAQVMFIIMRTNEGLYTEKVVFE